MKAQINKAAVLRKAWNDFKSTSLRTMERWSDCLRNAWAFYKEAAAMGANGKAFFIQNIKEQILETNFRLTRGVAYDGVAYVRSVMAASCGFASEVAASVLKYGKCSEKQAYVIARACYDLGI